MLKGWIGICPEFPFLIPTLNAKLITQVYMKVKATQHLHQGKIGLQFNKMCGILYSLIYSSFCLPYFTIEDDNSIAITLLVFAEDKFASSPDLKTSFKTGRK